MKSLFNLAIAGLCFSDMIFAAGPILNSTDLAPIGTITQSYQVTSSGKIDPGSAGENQTWDFSSLQATAAVTVEVVDPSSVPANIAAALPSANRWEKNNTGSAGSYNAYQLTNAFFNQIAIGAHTNSTSDILYTRLYTIPLTYFHFPFSLGDTFNDSSQASGSSVFTYSQQYDAYGTLKTPQGTYTNVIRIKTVSANTHVAYRWCTSSPCWTLMLNTDSTSVTFFTLQTSSTIRSQATPVLKQTDLSTQSSKPIDLLGRIQNAGHFAHLPDGIFLNCSRQYSKTLQIMKSK